MKKRTFWYDAWVLGAENKGVIASNRKEAEKKLRKEIKLLIKRRKPAR